MKETIDFLRRLKANNNREWFAEHKDEYDKARLLFISDVERLIRLMSEYDEELVGLTPQQCIFRIYRDLRFSHDKTPYKPYFSASIMRGGRKGTRAGYYLQIEPGDCGLYGGIWCPEPSILRLLRNEIEANAEEWTSIVTEKKLKKVFPEFWGEVLKNVPKGYDKESICAEWLKRKDYIAQSIKDDSYFEFGDWVERTAADFKLIKPLNDFVNYTLDTLDSD